MYSEVPWRLIKNLSRKKERDRSGLTVAEGPSVVLSALKAQIEVHAVILARDFADEMCIRDSPETDGDSPCAWHCSCTGA